VLPATYQMPGGLALLLAGIVVCFYGYRMFRVALAMIGFILGAGAASSVFGVSDTMPMLVAAAVGGLIGASLLYTAYFVGVALFGAGLGAVVASYAFSAADREPPLLAVLLCAIAGAVGSTYVQRYFSIVGTGFVGALMIIHGALAAAGSRLGLPGSDTVWIPYPLEPAPGQRWVPIAWGLLGLIGIAVQLGWTGGERGRVGRRKPKT
jgi:hypothetical protein